MADTKQIIQLYAEAPLTFVDIVTQRISDKNAFHPFVTGDSVSGLIISLSGAAIFAVGKETYTVKPGMVLHVGPNIEVARYLVSESAFEYVVIHFSLPAESADRYSLFRSHFSIPIDDYLKLTNRVQQLVHNSMIPGMVTLLQSKGLFLKILEEILAACENEQLKDADNLDAITDYMYQFYPDGITAVDVATHFNTDSRKLSTLFMRTIGVSPNVYLTALRIQQAKLLLRTSNLPVAEIAESVGYKDHFYFSRVFKKETGVPPSRYRKQMG